MADKRYSEIPRDISSSSVAAMRLAQGSPERDRWRVKAAYCDIESPTATESSFSIDSASTRVVSNQPSFRLSTSVFRSNCFGQKESPESDESTGNMILSSATMDKCHRHRSRRGATLPFSHHSLPRSSSMMSMGHSSIEDSPVRSLVSPVALQILHLSPSSVAAQLTLLDMPVFKSINPEELSSCGWSKQNKSELAPNVVAMTRRFNHVIFWTVQEILNEENVRQRADIVANFIHIAKKLHEMNNLHSLFAILSALRSASVFRLLKTWSAVPKKDIQHFEKLSDLFSVDNNWEKLRQHLDTLRLPCVPYLGLFLTDLTFTDIAHPHCGGLESPQRELKMNNILRIVSHYQQSDYSYLPVHTHIMEYLRSANYHEELQKFLEDDQYKLSMKLEPKTPAGTTCSKESYDDINKPMAKLSISGDNCCENGKFMPGHRRTATIRTNFFRYVQTSDQPSDTPVENSSTTIVNPGFDCSVRNLIDDSIKEEDVASSLQADADTAAVDPHDQHSANGSTHSITRFDSPIPFAAVQPCCFQGCVRTKAILKGGRKPTFNFWQRFWMKITGPALVFYRAKSLGGDHRAAFQQDPCKTVCILGWLVKRHRDKDFIELLDPVKRNAYKIRIVQFDETRDWVFHLKQAAGTLHRNFDSSDLISFE